MALLQLNHVATNMFLSIRGPMDNAFRPGLCFYPEFGVSVRSSEKGPGPTLVRQVRSSENAGTAGLEFGKKTGLNPGSAGSE